MATATLVPTEAEAAELEGLVSIDRDTRLKAIYRKERSLNAKIEGLEKDREELRNQLRAELAEHAHQGLTLGGKVVVRLSKVRTGRVSSKTLKEKHPKIWAALVSYTESMRLNID